MPPRKLGAKGWSEADKKKVEVYTADGFSAGAIHKLHGEWSINSIKTLQKRIRKKMKEGEGGGEAGEGGALVIGEEGHEDEDAAGTAAEAAAAAAAAAPVVPMMAPLPAMGSGDPLPAAAAPAVPAAKPAAKPAAAKKIVRSRSTARIPIAALKAKLQESPGISLSALGKLYKVSRYSVSKAIKRHVGGKSVRRVRVHRLKGTHREKRLAWARRLKLCLDLSPFRRLTAKITHLKLDHILFSDEKLVRYSSPKLASQNSRIRIGPGETKLGEIKKQAEPFLMPRDTYSVSKGVMIHVVMSGRNGAVQPFFVDSSVKMDAKQYQTLLQNYVVPHIYAGGYEMDCFRFQHDGAPAHSVKSTQVWLAERNIQVLDWPANSPDLSPLDFFFWSRLELELQRQFPDGFKSDEELRGGVLRAAQAIPQEQCKAAIKDFYKRLCEVIQQEGRQIEASR